MQRTTYKAMRGELRLIVDDIQILSGDTVGPSDSTWQDVAGTLAVNLRSLAAMLDNWRGGNADTFCTFPGLDDIGLAAVDCE
jgi:hypothetical protein